MANALYDKGRQAFLEGSIATLTDTIKAVLVDTGVYTVDLVNHQYLSSLTGTVGTAVTLGTKTTSAGVFDAADISFTALSSAPSIEAIVIYKDTGTAATSPLLAYIDTATGLPVAAGATQVDVTWDNGTNKIFKL